MKLLGYITVEGENHKVLRDVTETMADVNIQMSLMVIRIHLLIINFRIPAGQV